VFVLLGYELTRFDDALGLRVTYGNSGNEESDSTHQDTHARSDARARELAPDLLDLADKIEGNESPPANALH
jgi:hypothetical protein